MRVEEIMTKDVITLKKDQSIKVALEILNKHHIRHIPIVDDKMDVIGIVSDRDLRDASPSIFNSNLNCEDLKQSPKELSYPVEKIMTTNVITVHPLDFVEEISAIFYEREIACLPVTKDGKLIGIVTEKDMLYTLIQLTGAHQPGSLIEVKVKNIAGILAKVTSIMGRRNINIHSVLVYPDAKDSNYKILNFRIQTMNPMLVINDLKNEGYNVLWPSLPGDNQ